MRKKGFTLILSMIVVLCFSGSAFAADRIGGNDFAKGVSPQYTMTVNIPQESYNVGDSFTADIVVTTTESSAFSSFGFTLDYDKTELTLVSFAKPLEGLWDSNLENGRGGYSIYGDTPIAVNAQGVTIAQAEFKAKKATNAADIGLTAPEMTYPNEETPTTPTVVTDTAKIYDIQIALVAGNSTFPAGSPTTYYAKYNEIGLYTDANRTEKATTLTVPTAKTGYRLANLDGEGLWSDSGNIYKDNAAVLATKWHESRTLTVQTVKTQTVTFDGGTNGTVANRSFVVDKGGKLTAAQLNSVVVTPNSGYKFDYWYLTDSNTAVNPTTVTINADTVFHAKYSVTEVSYNVTFKAGKNGTVSNSSFEVKQGATLTEAQLNSVVATPDNGYKFEYWYLTDSKVKVNPTGIPINTDTVFYAKFYENAMPFVDVPRGEWYYNSVEFCFNNGLMNGTSDTTFDPEGNVTRGMLATVIYRMAGSPIVDYNMTFVDVPADMYYYNPIRWAASIGIVTGYSATEFLPERNLSREEMVTMLWRYAGKPTVEPDAGFYSYTDVGSIQGYALPAMKWAYMKGIIKGVTTSTIVPGGNATRSQFATIMERSINIIQ